MEWITKNLKVFTIIFIFLFLIKTCQSSNRKSKIEYLEKRTTELIDSVKKDNQIIIDSLENQNMTKEYLIKDLSTELKIAGIKIDEAQKRAEAVQQTAEKVKTNTTIQIKGSEEVKDSNK